MNIVEKLKNIIEEIEDGSDSINNEDFVKALEFYADEKNWVPGGTAFAPTPAPIAADMGNMARKVLGLNSKPEVKSKKSKKKGRPNKKIDFPVETKEKVLRPPAELVKVQCSCGYKEEVPRMLAFTQGVGEDGNPKERKYRCSKCIRKGGLGDVLE